MKIIWNALIPATLTVSFIIALPFINSCESEESRVCTWDATTQGNGSGRSFTDFYGLTIFHP